MRPFDAVRPSAGESAAARPGDSLVPSADVVMDRAFTITAPRESVWPWLVQLGKGRAGWYLPRGVERLVPRSRRAARRIEDRWQQLAAGDVIADYGGREATFTVSLIEAPATLVYSSTRGHTNVSWSINLVAAGDGATTRVHLRLRLGPVRHPRIAHAVGGFIDLLTIAGLASGLAERIAATA